ncbi:hypothetical protein HMPREF0645_1666 [Hallella bergensis DSM 17361]|uniref:Uncharacterized protein n=1 Tax=Hallella bergensis DSM 17361 TaxID=585502 RepID=D1PXI1_9BACT|nr:hypothetical protein [Hallella bergensis]EFA43948.1 hypothetical protein HMPREF0645_1666 [Hallella bergensis DSM 17361]
MKQLNKLQSLLFIIGGILMVVGAGCFALIWQQSIACWVFLAGALLFTTMQILQSYEGRDITIRRLKRIQGLADILFLLAGMLMADKVYGFFRPLFSNMVDYTNYLFNKWVVVLLIAAILEVYTVHRLDHELSKKNIKE